MGIDILVVMGMDGRLPNGLSFSVCRLRPEEGRDIVNDVRYKHLGPLWRRLAKDLSSTHVVVKHGKNFMVSPRNKPDLLDSQFYAVDVRLKGAIVRLIFLFSFEHPDPQGYLAVNLRSRPETLDYAMYVVYRGMAYATSCEAGKFLMEAVKNRSSPRVLPLIYDPYSNEA